MHPCANHCDPDGNNDDDGDDDDVGDDDDDDDDDYDGDGGDDDGDCDKADTPRSIMSLSMIMPTDIPNIVIIIIIKFKADTCPYMHTYTPAGRHIRMSEKVFTSIPTSRIPW